MKKILYIFLTLSIISVGCSDDNTVQPTSNLDANLFGVWVYTNINVHTETYTFLSNESWTFDYISSTHEDTYSGTWLTQNQMLYLSYLVLNNDEETIPYSIQGDSLILEMDSNGESRVYIKQ